MDALVTEPLFSQNREFARYRKCGSASRVIAIIMNTAASSLKDKFRRGNVKKRILAPCSICFVNGIRTVQTSLSWSKLIRAVIKTERSGCTGGCHDGICGPFWLTFARQITILF